MIESGLDSGEYLACDITQNGGGTWMEWFRLDGNASAEDVWHSAPIPSYSTPEGTFRIRFRAKMSATDEDAFVDNIRVVAE